MEVKTPLIIKEALGEEVYEMFEKYRKSLPPAENRSIKIWTSEEGKRLFEEAIKEEYDTREQGKKGRNKI